MSQIHKMKENLRIQMKIEGEKREISLNLVGIGPHVPVPSGASVT